MSFTVKIDKENLKFSGSHFTIFSSQKAERLHGHNYYVTCNLTTDAIDPKLGMAFDFNLVKPLIKGICDRLDEYVLIPENSTFLEIRGDSKSIAVGFNNKQYVFPKEDVRLLPLINITSEELSRYFVEELAKLIDPNLKVKKLSVGITETHGQTVFFEKNL